MTPSDLATAAPAIEASKNLWIFFLLVLGVVLLPGLDMAYILASALGHGRRTGLAAVGGIAAGGVIHVTVGALGLATILAIAPAAFNTLLVVGALYVAWIGWGLARSGVSFSGDSLAAVAQPAGSSEAGPRAPAGPSQAEVAAFRGGALTNLLNPKAYVFMLAVFPQFVSATGPLWRQALALGTIITATQLAVYGVIVVAASAVRTWLTTRPAALRLVGRTIGVLLIGAAVFTGLSGWRDSTEADPPLTASPIAQAKSQL